MKPASLLLFGLLALMPARTAAEPTIRVQPIAAERECRFYLLCWGPWLLIECRSNFAAMRERLQGALAESGRFEAAGGRGANYEVTGRITELGLQTSSAAGRDYQLSTTRAVATLDLSVRERGSGRVIYAGTVTGSVDVAASLVSGGTSIADESNARAIYAILQLETALAAARAVAFRVDPLRVVAVSGRQVRLNYCAPLLDLDASVQISDANGFPVQYRVSGVMPDGAVADSAEPVSVNVGALASVSDRGSAPGGMNRFQRVEIPR